MITSDQVAKLLIPFGIELSSSQLAQTITYLELLLRWNARINLTAVRTAEDSVTRHFGESFYIVRNHVLHGENLDIGSGAGFPGLALKIISPTLRVTLLEPVAKKRAFLNEVARVSEMEGVEVRPERIEDLVGRESGPGELFDVEGRFESVTTRGVGRVSDLAVLARQCLKLGGRLCFWIGQEQIKELTGRVTSVSWNPPIPLPLSTRRVIAVGRRLD